MLSFLKRHDCLKKVRPLNRVKPWFNQPVERAMRERTICYNGHSAYQKLEVVYSADNKLNSARAR
jgi:hypothetical protein